MKRPNLADSLRFAQGRDPIRLSWILIAAVMAVAAISAQATARVQLKILCWEPDIEFPVPCDDDDN